MKRVLVGTAGHIDHGKTRLVLALTGTDCDRWAEEKARGITIDLGFAHLVSGDVQLGFVDVPGHERFLHNALAGLGGIRVMLLVVAADEGVKPQTVEHLAICSLLGIPAAVVALTKIDAAAPDLVELAQLEVEELLAATPFAGAPVLPVSSATGQGIADLERALVAAALRYAVDADPAMPARLPIDRAFHLRGHGVVVTGTLASGVVAAGDELELLPPAAGADADDTLRVRSVQVHNQPRETAETGERTSLQVTGAPLAALGRGQQLCTPGAFAATTSLLARVRLLPGAPPPGRGFTAVRIHLYAGQALGRLRFLRLDDGVAGAGADPGEGAAGLAEIRLQEPLAAARGDRLIVRRPSPAATLGGGQVLDPRWRRHRGGLLAAGLAALDGDAARALGFWVLEAGEPGLGAAEAGRRLGWPAARAAQLLAELARGARLIEVPEGPGHERRWIAPAVVERVVTRARRVMADWFARERLADGCPKAEAVRRILRGRAVELAATYLVWLAAQKVLVVRGDQVMLPGRSGAQLSGEESQLAVSALACFERGGLAPPSPGEVRQELTAKPQILEGVLRHLVARGKLVRLPGGLIIAATAIEELRRNLLATPWDHFSIPQFKDHFSLSRKWAIPLLEHLDSLGATLRTGADRVVVRRAPPPPDAGLAAGERGIA